MAQTLTITGITGNINLMDGTNYMAEEWVPNVATLRDSTLGGWGLFSDVDEQIRVRCLGATPAAVYANVQRLATELLFAERFSRGENIPGIYLNYEPSKASGGGTPQSAVVIGRGARDETSGVKLDVTFDQAGLVYQTTVTFGFRRRGLWLVAGEIKTAAAADVPSVLSVAFNSTPSVPSPVAVDLIYSGGSPNIIPSGVLVFAPQASDIQIIEGESFTGGVGFATQGDSGRLARGGSVLRASPGTPNTPITTNGQALNLQGVPHAVWASVRNNTATNQTYALRVNLQTPGSLAQIRSSTAWATIPPSMNTPTILPLGLLTYGRGMAGANQMSLSIQADIGGGNGLDIDWICIVPLRNELCGAVPFESTASIAGTGGTWRLTFESQALGLLRPVLLAQNNAGTTTPVVPLAPLPIFTGGTLAVALLQTQGINWSMAVDPNTSVRLQASLSTSIHYGRTVAQ